jgi:Leucine-rich repeat (LRR) protein
MYKIVSFIALFLLVSISQAQVDSTRKVDETEFSDLKEALKNPSSVKRLNLSNQTFQMEDSLWLNFTNLEFLSLKNDHLMFIPSTIGDLPKLKILDISGNDFKLLPSSFSNLKTLEELFLNEEKNFNLEKNIDIISRLPNLKILHLEYDSLTKLPRNITKLNQIESLYLNNNLFKSLPKELKSLKSLKYLDFHGNKMHPVKDAGFGMKIDF